MERTNRRKDCGDSGNGGDSGHGVDRSIPSPSVYGPLLRHPKSWVCQDSEEESGIGGTGWSVGRTVAVFDLGRAVRTTVSFEFIQEPNRASESERRRRADRGDGRQRPLSSHGSRGESCTHGRLQTVVTTNQDGRRNLYLWARTKGQERTHESLGSRQSEVGNGCVTNVNLKTNPGVVFDNRLRGPFRDPRRHSVSPVGGPSRPRGAVRKGCSQGQGCRRGHRGETRSP